MGGGERVVVAHSLACLLWLHAADRGLVDPPADRVLLVAPPSPAVTVGVPRRSPVRRTGGPGVGVVVAAGPPSGWSPRTPTSYSTEGTAHALYGEPLGLDSDVLPGAGHLTIEDGFGPWPAVLAWALDPATRIT